jgi:16S rRNA processing protein RimM
VSKHPPSEYIVIAKVGAPKGLKGHLKITLISQTPLCEFKEFYLFCPNSGLVSSGKSIDNGVLLDKKALIKSGASGNQFLLKFPDINNPEDARAYTHYLVCVKHDQLPKLNDDEFYWADLEGLSVYTDQDVYLGMVDYLVETGSNDVMFVTNKEENKTRCLPFMSPTLIDVDFKAKKILVDWDPDF